MSPKYFAEALSEEYNRKIETRDVEKAWKKMGLTYLDENNSPKLTDEGKARGGQVTQSGFAFSFDYDSLKKRSDRSDSKEKALVQQYPQTANQKFDQTARHSLWTCCNPTGCSQGLHL